jgi:hypothetical protein
MSWWILPWRVQPPFESSRYCEDFSGASSAGVTQADTDLHECLVLDLSACWDWR